MSTTNNKRIAKNTFYLYVRMLIVMVVQLYTVRVVLNALGVEDYGIYNVVAGVVVIFNFLTTTMSSATSRFLTFEMGRGNMRRLTETFQTALFLHICISLIILVLAETIGLWVVCNKLVIPENRKFAAEIVYQFAILTVIIKTIQVPFNASIISNERMDTYAKIEIANVVVTLGLVYFLKVWDGDRLIFYGVMLAVIALMTTLFYAVFCLRKFYECSWRIKYNTIIIKEMSVFSGWDLYGNFCVTARIQGVNIILNLFFGPVLNAATGISANVQTAIMSFGNNVITAFKPQIIKKYAAQEFDEMERLAGYALKFSLLLFAIISVPIFIEMPFVLKLWLKTPPEYTIGFTRISLVTGLLAFTTSVLNIPIHATGKIKRLSFFSGTMFLLILPICYFALKIFTHPETAYIITLIMVALNVGVVILIVKKLLPWFHIRNFVVKGLIPTIIVIIISYFITIFARHFVTNEMLGFCITVVISSIVIISLSVAFIIPKQLVKELICKLKAQIH